MAVARVAGAAADSSRILTCRSGAGACPDGIRLVRRQAYVGLHEVDLNVRPDQARPRFVTPNSVGAMQVFREETMDRPGLTFSHMGIYVTDVARMEDFYTRLLEFTVTDRGELDTPNGPVFLVFLSRDPDEHHQ